MKPFFVDQPEWDDLIGRIYVALERVTLSERGLSNRLELRRRGRIQSIHSSTAIEGNRLSEAEVRGVINGLTVFGYPQDIREVQNAWSAYQEFEAYDPFSVDSFLRAHGLMTHGLITQSGIFRTGDVEVVNDEDPPRVLHVGADPEIVAEGVQQLLVWARDTTVHPLISSSATHFMIEFIHPFQDGNGRMGRLWQTILLSRWNEMFAWMPTETVARHHQLGYYQALQASHNGKIEASPFITYMLKIIEESLQEYHTVITEDQREGVNEGVNEGVSLDSVDTVIVDLLREDGSRTAVDLAHQVQRSVQTVERRLSKLKSSGLLRRHGSDKTGVWIVKG